MKTTIKLMTVISLLLIWTGAGYAQGQNQQMTIQQVAPPPPPQVPPQSVNRGLTDQVRQNLADQILNNKNLNLNNLIQRLRQIQGNQGGFRGTANINRGRGFNQGILNRRGRGLGQGLLNQGRGAQRQGILNRGGRFMGPGRGAGNLGQGIGPGQGQGRGAGNLGQGRGPGQGQGRGAGNLGQGIGPGQGQGLGAGNIGPGRRPVQGQIRGAGNIGRGLGFGQGRGSVNIGRGFGGRGSSRGFGRGVIRDEQQPPQEILPDQTEKLDVNPLKQDVNDKEETIKI
ncbi:MAG: hypothetical protein GY869_15165 [Planctomycetes bacterium]|nr:hypothetical protein [Planctomycetota bacterium]